MSTGTQTEVVMPQMGVSVSEGTVTKWLKQVGEAIGRDEPLLEISTDKVDTEVPSPAEGVVAQILVQEGETVEVGTVLAVITPAGVAPRPRPSSLPPPRPSPCLRRPSRWRPLLRLRLPLPHRPPSLPRHLRLSRPPPQGTERHSSPRSSRASPPSTASTPRPFRAPAPAGGSRRRTS